MTSRQGGLVVGVPGYSIGPCRIQTNITGPAPRTSDGYSLIELTLVLALITLLMWVAVPRYGAQLRPHRRNAP